MSIKSVELETIARICVVAVGVLRDTIDDDSDSEAREWDDMTPDEQGKITNYVVAVLQGRQTPETPEGRMISRICHQFQDPKKTLKYA